MQSSTPQIRTLRILLAETDPNFRQHLVLAIEQSQLHLIVGQALTGLELVEMALELKPDMLLFDIHLPQLNGLDAMRRITTEHPVAAIAFTADRDPGFFRRISHEPIQAVFIKPFDPTQLLPTVEIAWARFEQIRSLTIENDKLQRSLESRKVIERAKGVLMRRHRWTEAEAFRRLQRGAMNRRLSMADLARQILDGREIEL